MDCIAHMSEEPKIVRGTDLPPQTVILVMGVAGAGKTSVARALAATLGWHFLDADDLHYPSNIEKMAAGIPLTDLDRAGWLDVLHARVGQAIAAKTPTVLACSALKQSYRDQIWLGPEMQIVYLKLTREQARHRLQKRKEHFMPESLIESQFATLEEPPNAVTVEATLPIDVICVHVKNALGL